MSTKNTFESCIVEAVRKYFVWSDFHLTMKTLADATEHHIYTVTKDMQIDGHEVANDIASEVWHIADVMAFLSELYHWNTEIDKHSKTEQP